MCCQSAVCPAGQVYYGVHPYGSKRTCPGLSFDLEGMAHCAIAEYGNENQKKALGIGQGCCIKARALAKGVTYDFAMLPPHIKRGLAQAGAGPGGKTMTIQETINRKFKENLNLTNEERAQRAEAAIAAYPGGDPEDLSATIVDLIADLMHLAHANDIEPDYVARMSQDHYNTEVEEEVKVRRNLYRFERDT
jgi:hypothetical protein